MVKYNCCLQFVLVQFLGIVFNTVALTLDQWFWSIAFGVGELLWGQVSLLDQ